MGTLRKVKGVYPLMDKGFRLLWYICMGEVQQYFWQNHTDLVPYLYEPLARDVITPGEINSQEAIQNNNFPLFSTDSQGLVFRYMRYWIEVAYSKLEIAQPEAKLKRT